MRDDLSDQRGFFLSLLAGLEAPERPASCIDLALLPDHDHKRLGKIALVRSLQHQLRAVEPSRDAMRLEPSGRPDVVVVERSKKLAGEPATLLPFHLLLRAP